MPPPHLGKNTNNNNNINNNNNSFLVFVLYVLFVFFSFLCVIMITTMNILVSTIIVFIVHYCFFLLLFVCYCYCYCYCCINSLLLFFCHDPPTFFRLATRSKGFQCADPVHIQRAKWIMTTGPGYSLQGGAVETGCSDLNGVTYYVAT